MHIGIIGAGHVEPKIARPLILAGNQVTLSLARDRTALSSQASEIDGKIATPADAAPLERWPRNGVLPFVRKADPVFGSAVDSTVHLPSELSGAQGAQKDKE